MRNNEEYIHSAINKTLISFIVRQEMFACIQILPINISYINF